MLTTKGIREFNVIIKNTANVRILFGYCYPSTYRAGMTNLATHLFYSLMNSREDTSCERYFRYDTHSPAHSVESRRPLKANHVIGFSLSYEEDILNVLNMLKAGGIPLLARDRGEEDPIVVMGGPVVSANPEPFVDFIDVFAIGEGDDVIHNILDGVKESESKKHALSLLADVRGLYVPIMEQSHVERLIIPDLNKAIHPINQIIPDVSEGDGLEPVFGKAFLAEITRGCGHSCKFCLVGHICKPRRVRTYKKVIEILASGLENTPVKKIALIGSSLGDMDRLEEVAQWILNQGCGFSVPSLRADSVSEDLVKMLIEGGQRTLTIAPETGSPSLRRDMGKGLTDEDIERAVRIAADSNMYSIKLYYIIGLPGETEQDVLDIAKLTEKLAQKNNIRITASVNPFIPKAFTRFQREPQPSIEDVREKIRLVERSLKSVPRVTTEFLDPRHARVQAALSIGGRELGVVIREAFRHGGLAGWRKAEKETGVQFFSIANDTSRLQKQLPWDFLT